MAFDWKWIIGIVIGVAGIAAPIAYDRYSKAVERRQHIADTLEAAIKATDKVEVRIDRLRSMARLPTYPGQPEPLGTLETDALAVLAQGSDALKKVDPMRYSDSYFDSAPKNIAFLFDDLEYCPFLDETALPSLTFARDELTVARNVLRFEMAHGLGELTAEERDAAVQKLFDTYDKVNGTAVYTPMGHCQSAAYQ